MCFLSVPFPKAHQHTASTYRSLFPVRQPLPTGVVLLGHLAPQEQCCDLTQRLLRPSPPRTGARFNSKPRANSSSTSVWLTSPSPRRSAAAPPAQLPAHALTLRPLFGLVLLLLSLPFPSFLVLLFSLLSSLFSLPPSPSSSVLLLFLSHCSPLLPPSTPPLLANAGESLQLVEAPANARAECARMA